MRTKLAVIDMWVYRLILFSQAGQKSCKIMKLRFLFIGAAICAVSFQSLYANYWTTSGAPSNHWAAITCSPDGTRLTAAAYADISNNLAGIYTSTNCGATWTLLTNAPLDAWRSLASSSDGTTLAAVDVYGAMYVSTNSGAFWANADSTHDWYYVTCTPSGAELAAVSAGDFLPGLNGSGIFISTDGGATWTPTAAPTNAWSSIALSADGTKLAGAASDDAVGNYGSIYLSSDSGATWARAGAPTNRWYAITSSADGTRLGAVAVYDPSGNYVGIYISTNSGASWSQGGPSNNWFCITCSADGTRWAAADNTDASGNPGSVFLSTDFGATWTQSNVASNYWQYGQALGFSGDGKRLVAVTDYDAQHNPGPIYIWQPTTLNAFLSGGDVAISWTTNDAGGTLEQNYNLATTNWIAVTNSVNIVNDQYQVLMPLFGSDSFFRLESQP